MTQNQHINLVGTSKGHRLQSLQPKRFCGHRVSPTLGPYGQDPGLHAHPHVLAVDIDILGPRQANTPRPSRFQIFTEDMVQPMRHASMY